jgi:hypothetical protein
MLTSKILGRLSVAGRLLPERQATTVSVIAGMVLLRKVLDILFLLGFPCYHWMQDDSSTAQIERQFEQISGLKLNN